MMKNGFILTFILFLAIIGYVKIFYVSDNEVANIHTEIVTQPFIDAGHGGMDCGAISLTGVFESDINLQIAKKTEILFRFLGYSPKMTREEDISLHDPQANTIREKKRSDLAKRVSMINANSEFVLVSIHQNIFSENKYSGSQIFYNSNGNSKILADFVKESLQINLDPNNKREIKKSVDVFLMSNVKNTAILVECGFLSNPNEEMLLRNSNYQTKIAIAIANGYIKWDNSTV